MSETNNKHSVWREYLEALLVAGLFLGFTNTFILKTFYIPSGSMENTLLVGDHLIVNRFIYGPDGGPLPWVAPNRDPERGDIVVFRSPVDPSIDLVKRCVAVGGDTVEIIEKQLFVNGQAVSDSDYAIHSDPQVAQRRNRRHRHWRRDNMAPYTVPEGEFFFLGDNRDHSNDSRYWHSVPRELIKGRAFLIYWSYGGETPDGEWYGWGHKIGQLGRTALGFVSKSRWGRSFQIIR